MSPEIAEMLGVAPKPVRPGLLTAKQLRTHRANSALPRGERAAAVLEALVANKRQDRETGSEEQVHMTVADALQGVTVSWIAQVFSMDPATVKKRLKDCPPLHRKKTGFVYDLKVAAGYLVQPKVNLENYLKTMKVSELPVHLQKEYWAGMKAKQDWEKNAGELWRTNDVLDVFSDVFLTIKNTMLLWPDAVERSTGLTQIQRTMLTDMFDAMQTDLHKRLVAMPGLKQTASSLAEGEVAAIPLLAGVEDDDDASHYL